MPNLDKEIIDRWKMIIDTSETLWNDQAAQKIENDIEKKYTSEIDEHIKQLLSFKSDAKGLRDFIYDNCQKGQFLGELDAYLELLEDGEGIHHPRLVPFLSYVVYQSDIGQRIQNLELTTPKHLLTQIGWLLSHQYEEYQYAHVFAMKSCMKSWSKGIVLLKNDLEKYRSYLNTIADAIEVTQEMATEYKQIFSDIADRTKAKMPNVSQSSYEHEKYFSEFISKWVPTYEAIGKDRSPSSGEEGKYNFVAQKWSTIYFLSGVLKRRSGDNRVTKDAFVFRLLPIQLMNRSVLRDFLPQFEERLSDEKKTSVMPGDTIYDISWFDLFERLDRKWQPSL